MSAELPAVLTRHFSLPHALTQPSTILTFRFIGVVGVGCPFCSFVLPVEEMLNDLLTHIGATHSDVNMRGIVLGEAIVLQTERGDFTLRPVERFN
jgi:hypothetical protein